MKKLTYIKISVFLAICLVAGIRVTAQDSVVAEPTVKVRYFIDNNSMQYVMVQSGLQAGKKFEPLPKQVVKLFLDSSSAENLITKTYTDENGKAKITIPITLQSKWNSSPKHKFIAVLEATSVEDERTTELEVTKAKILIDTVTNDGIRSITGQVFYYENNEWVPAKDVELRLGVQRFGGILSAGAEESFTTDSTGAVSVEFNKDSMPGDQKGNIMLVAKVEDNELYGNLIVGKKVPWGIPTTVEKGFFDQRTLWSTRFRTPLWLLFMAYGIMLSVWGTIIYLVIQIVKIKKLGVAAAV